MGGKKEAEWMPNKKWDSPGVKTLFKFLYIFLLKEKLKKTSTVTCQRKKEFKMPIGSEQVFWSDCDSHCTNGPSV